MSDDKKLYAERDVIGLGDFYSRHASAMTGEQLHNKADIAAELGWRDQQIEDLQDRVNGLAANQQSVSVPESWRLTIQEAIKMAYVFDDGGDGAGGESARGVVSLLIKLLDTADKPNNQDKGL